MKTIFAIDPGASGGIAVQYKDYKAVCFPMPETEGDLIRLLSSYHDEPSEKVYFLENLVKHAGNAIPASAMAVYASNWGFIKGAIQMQGCPLHLVDAKKWQKLLSLGSSRGMKKREWKAKLKAEAQRLYPHLDVTLKTADALLLLAYAKAQPN